MKNLIVAAVLWFAAGPARAQLAGCQHTSGLLQLQKVRATASGTQILGCLNASFDVLSSSTAVPTSTSAVTFVSSVTITGAGGLSVTYGISAATITTTGAATIYDTLIASANVNIRAGSTEHKLRYYGNPSSGDPAQTNVLMIQNMHPNLPSAIRFEDAAGDEMGAIGYSNLNGNIYGPNIMFLGLSSLLSGVGSAYAVAPQFRIINSGLYSGTAHSFIVAESSGNGAFMLIRDGQGAGLESGSPPVGFYHDGAGNIGINQNFLANNNTDPIMPSTLTVVGSAQFGSTGISTFSSAGGLAIASGQSITLSGGGQITGASAGLYGTPSINVTNLTMTGAITSYPVTISGGSVTVNNGIIGTIYGISAATGNFTGTGANYSLTTSSGISVGSGQILFTGAGQGVGYGANAGGVAGMPGYGMYLPGNATYGSVNLVYDSFGNQPYIASRDSRNPATVPKFAINATGVGIGTDSPATPLHVVGAIRQTDTLSCTLGLKSDANGTITGCVASSRTIKKNISDSVYSGSIIDKLRPRYFEYINPSRDGGGLHAGFIAEEVEEVFPRAVVPAGENLKGVDANAMISLLVQEVQQLRKRVAVLEKNRVR